MKPPSSNKDLRELAQDTEGLSTIEYIILLVLVAIVGIGAWSRFGGSVGRTIGSSERRVEGLNNTANTPN